MPKAEWPANNLAIELRKLNRDFMRASPLAHLRGREVWPNQDAEMFADELALSQTMGIRPSSPNDPQFDELMKNGERFNWAILLDGSLRVSRATALIAERTFRISHAILANGGEVLAAGEGRGGDFLSHTTGHYKNEVFVVEPVKCAFEQIGIIFKT